MGNVTTPYVLIGTTVLIYIGMLKDFFFPSHFASCSYSVNKKAENGQDCHYRFLALVLHLSLKRTKQNESKANST